MKKQEVIEMIQHYRHDVLNELQLFKSYLTLGKIDQVEQKLNDWLDKFNQERQLFQLNAPEWTVWLMSFNYKHSYFRQRYKLHLKNSPNLCAIDEDLVAYSIQVIAWVEAHARDEFYDIDIELIEKNNVPEIMLRFTINGFYSDQEIDHHVLGQVEQTKDGMICEWSYLVK